MTVTLKVAVFWNMTPCSVVDICTRISEQLPTVVTIIGNHRDSSSSSSSSSSSYQTLLYNIM
jgi:hypothetical protein